MSKQFNRDEANAILRSAFYWTRESVHVWNATSDWIEYQWLLLSKEPNDLHMYTIAEAMKKIAESGSIAARAWLEKNPDCGTQQADRQRGPTIPVGDDPAKYM